MDPEVRPAACERVIKAFSRDIQSIAVESEAVGRGVVVLDLDRAPSLFHSIHVRLSFVPLEILEAMAGDSHPVGKYAEAMVDVVLCYQEGGEIPVAVSLRGRPQYIQLVRRGAPARP